MSATVDVPVYLAIEPRKRAYPYGGKPGRVLEAAVVAHTTKRPPVRAGVLVVRIVVRVPSAAFDPLQPEAVVVIPAELTDARPIVVVAQDPGAAE